MKISDVDDAISGLILSEEIKPVRVRSKKCTILHYVSVKSKTEGCLSDIVSHNEVYKGESKEKNTKDSNILLYTPPRDTTTLIQAGQDQKEESRAPEESENPSSTSEAATISPDPHRDLPTPTKKKPGPSEPVKVRILKEWRTQIPRPGVPNAFDDRLYRVGEVIEVPRWKVEDLQKKGIAEVVQ